MKNFYLTLALLISCISITYSQGKITVRGSKNVNMVSTKLDKFKKILLDGEFNIILEKGEKPQLTVETDDNIQEFITGKVEGGTLTIHSRAIIRSKKALNVTITYVDGLEEIETTGTGHISSGSTLDFKNITFRVSGGSRSELNIKAETFKLIVGENSHVSLNLEATKAEIELSENSHIEGSMYSTDLIYKMHSNSSAKAQGEVITLNIETDNSADFDGRELKSQNTKIVSNSRSNIHINSTDSLEIDTAGSSEIYVYSNPKITLHSFLDASVLRKK